MKESFISLLGYDKILRISLDETEIKQFCKTHNLEDVKIRFGLYRRTPMGFLKLLFARLTKREVVSGDVGRHNYLTRTIRLFIDSAAYSLADKSFVDAPVEDKAAKLKQELPKALSHALAHEFGHAKEKTITRLRELLSWKLLVPILHEKHLWQAKISWETIAEEFAKQHAGELEAMFHIEEVEQ